MKKTTILICLAVAILLPLGVRAFAVKTANSVYVRKEETIEGNLYAAGSNIVIDGSVKGDLICAGQTINVNGQVDGDIICAGQSVNVNGEAGGSIRVAGSSVNLNGKIARNVMAAGASIILANNAQVGWDMLTAGANVEILGKVSGDLHGAGANYNLAGEVGRNVSLRIDSRVKSRNNNLAFKNKLGLTIGPNAVINGDLKYTSEQDAAIDAKAVIKGQTVHNLPKAVAKKFNFLSLPWWWGRLLRIFSALVIGLVLISFWRSQIIEITDLMLNKIGPSFGWGILTLILAPIIVFILLITIIGLPLSLILTALWLIALYVSKILTGILIGRSLLNNFLAKQKDSLILAMIMGIIISYLIFSLPFMGWLAGLLAILWGLGGIMLALKNK